MLRFSGFLAILALTINTSDADTLNETNDFWDLTLEQLLQLRVTLASKTAEPPRDVPANLTVLSASQLSRLGLASIYDVLNYVPGFQATRGNQIGDAPLLHVRGVAQNSGFVLVMLNGYRLNEVSLGNATVYAPFLSTLNVERVEVIRGPGSAVYGSNALLGIVNIITRQDESELGIGLATSDERSLSAQLSVPLGDLGKLSIFGYSIKDNGQHFQLLDGRDTRDPQSHQGLQLNVQADDWSGFLSYQQDATDDFLVFGRVADFVQFNRTQVLLAGLKASHSLHERLTVESNVSYSRHNLDALALIVPSGGDLLQNFYAGPYSQSSELQAQVEFQAPLTSYYHLLAGVQYREAGLDYSGAYSSHIAEDLSQIGPVNDFYTGGLQRYREIGGFADLVRRVQIRSLYLQQRIQFSPRWLSFVGLRSDEYSIGGNSLNPRLALHFHPDDNHTVKLLYASAYRAPTHNELFSNDPVSRGNVALKPEQVDTLELSFLWQYSSLTGSAAVFHNSIKDSIGLNVIDTDQALGNFENGSGRTQEGVEFELDWSLGEHWQWRLTGTEVYRGGDLNSLTRYASSMLRWDLKPFVLQWNTLYRGNLKGVEWQGDAWLMDAHVRYAIKPSQELRLSLFNLTDKAYLGTNGNQGPQTLGIPARGRKLEIAFSLAFN